MNSEKQRKDPFRMKRIAEEICALLDRRKKEENFYGNDGAYFEHILYRYGKGLIVDRELLEAEIEIKVRKEIMAELTRERERHLADFQVEPIVEKRKKTA